MTSIRRFAGGLLGLGLTVAMGMAAEPPSREAVEFFEARVRPILAENCLSCHGEKKQEAGLRLDSKASLLKGSDKGPVVVAGDPDRSKLVHAIRYDDELQMPPRGKLPDEAVASLTNWVKMGIPWPDDDPTRTTRITDPATAKKHWAFQPVQRPSLPPVKDPAWPASPVDHFVLARLEARNLTPSPSADRRTLIRRVTFDLTGLPPTQEEIDAFLNDASPEAFARVVDRLLASPHYGERWGRYWLDVSRYADTKGYVFQEERRYPFAYTYRDYVVRALNEDLPYDQFIIQQLAADRLPGGDDPRPLAAMGYLTLGRRFLNNANDIIDDRIDVVTRGLLGLTVSCARCHDHKFDPIPTKDYYSLHGVFASSIEPRDLPLLGQPDRNEAYLAFEKELQDREKKVAEFLDSKYEERLAGFRQQVAPYLLAAAEAQRSGGGGRGQTPPDLSFSMVRRWQTFLTDSRDKHDPIYAPWHAFAALPAKDFAARAPEVASRLKANADATKPIHSLVVRAFDREAPTSLAEVAKRYGELFADVDREWQEALRKTPALKALPDPARESLRQALYGANAPANVPRAEFDRYLDRADRNQLRALQTKVDQYRATSPAAPPRAMVLVDAPTPVTPRVLVRGNPNNPGEQVPRQFLAVLAGDQRRPFQQGSGRLELARSIASRDNPLTARVLVNRVWLHHFGAPLVRTPSDFGTRSEPPTHPELLDHLAWQFMEEGWSIKKLHRAILLSRTYQQASDDRPEGKRIDADNTLLWKMNRQRLDFEALRDALLAVAGQLDLSVGGPAVDLTKSPYPRRRTIYGFIERQNLPGLFRTFDFASPDTHSPQRYHTTVPQQALFLMNSPFVVQQVRKVAARLTARPEDLEERIQEAYRLVYGRPASSEEVGLGLRFFEGTLAKDTPADSGKLNAWEEYAQVLLLANEFAFID